MHAFTSQRRASLSWPVFISLLLCLLAPAAHSATSRSDAHQSTWTENRNLEAAETGLVYSLPVINQKQLASQIQDLSQQLRHRKADLSQRIEQNHFTATDAVIVAVVPGGLLYAAVKKQRTAQAERELSQVVSQLDSLAEFSERSQPPLLAAR